MFGCGVCAGTLSLEAWPSGAVLAGLMALKAGDCTSCLTPLTAGGDPAVLLCAAESGAIVAAPPFGPVNGLAGAVGVPAFPDGGWDTRFPMLSRTCRCCRKRASLSTMTPGVAESRVLGVLRSEPGLGFSFNLSCCFGAAAALDMLSFSFGCVGSLTLDLASSSFLLKISCAGQYSEAIKHRWYMYLKLERKIVDVASILVVDTGILPNQTKCFLESVPTLEQCMPGGGLASHHSTNLLLYGGQRHRVFDQLVVVLQTARWKVLEGYEYLQTLT
jgi:hypothetical protein